MPTNRAQIDGLNSPFLLLERFNAHRKLALSRVFLRFKTDDEAIPPVMVIQRLFSFHCRE